MSKLIPLSERFPEISKQRHPTKNWLLTPDRIWSISKKKIRWRCEKWQDHERESTVSNRTKSWSWRPFCSKQKVCLSNCLAVTHPWLLNK